MTEIYIDGDACPVKNETYKVAERHKLMTYVVSNDWITIPQSPLIKNIIVDKGFDAADNWIADNCKQNDIVITSDIPLADRSLKNGASVLSPNGKNFSENSIGMRLAMRDLSSHLRETGEIKGYNPSFTKRDRSNFLNALENLIRKLK